MERYSPLKLILSAILAFGIVLIFNVWDVQWDLTPDQRYTLSPLAKDMVRTSDQRVTITVLLEGEKIPASFRNYRSYIDYYISELRRYDSDIEIVYKDPHEGDRDEVASFKQFLSQRGIEPTRRQAPSGEEININTFYPYISIHTDREIVFVNLLEQQIRGEAEEESLLRSQLAFEGKFLRGLRQLTRIRKPEVHLVGGSSRLLADGCSRDERLSGYHFVSSTSERLLSAKDSADAIIVVIKKEDLTRAELLAIDVVGGEGIPVIWLIDKFDTTIDSLRITGEHIAIANEYDVEDYLFRCGVKISPELILDLQSSFIPQVVNDGSSTPQHTMLKYPYHPIILPGEETPPMAHLTTPLATYFVSPISFLEYPKTVIKQSLLKTSSYTQRQGAPAQLDFGLMSIAPDPARYQTGPLTIGASIQGRVRPYFTNRLLEEDRALLTSAGLTYDLDSQYIDQVVLSDADFFLPVRDNSGRYYPIGYNQIEGQMYDANALLIAQLLESLIDGDDILRLAQKESALSLLDTRKYEANRTKYVTLLLIMPLLVLLIWYLLYHWYRKRKYAI